MITKRTLRNLAIIGFIGAGMFFLPKSSLRAQNNACQQNCVWEFNICGNEGCQPLCQAGETHNCNVCYAGCNSALQSCLAECEAQ